MINTIDNKIHHLKELDYIERNLFYSIDIENYYKQLRKILESETRLSETGTITLSEAKKVDEFSKNYFYNLVGEQNTWFLRAYVVGRLLADSDKQAKIFSIENINKLPKFVQDIARQHHLTLSEAKQIQELINIHELNLTATTTNTINQVKHAIIESISNREGISGVERRIRELTTEVGELNRDWQRVAISTVNSAFNNAYIQALEENDFVMGISMTDACKHCLELINNKIYQVIKEAPRAFNYLNTKNHAEYNRLNEIWKTKIWVNKTNYGRSTAKRKRIFVEEGNKEDNLMERWEHEKAVPAIPMHPNCRCRWIKFNPKFQWIDEDGNLRLSIEDKDGHENFYNNRIRPILENQENEE